MTTRPHPTTKQLLDQFNTEPDYSDASQDDAEALSRDRIPVRSLTAADFDAVVRIDRRTTGHDRSAYYRRKFDEALGESGVRNGSSRAIDVSASSGWTMGSTTARLDHTAGCVNEHFERDGQFRARSSTQTS